MKSSNSWNKKRIIVLTEALLALGGLAVLLRRVETNGIWEWFLALGGLFMVMPLLTIKKTFREPLRNYFITAKIKRKRIIISFLYFLVLLILSGLLVWRLHKTGNLPTMPWSLGGIRMIIFFDIFFLLPMVIFEEIFFRGFILGSFLPRGDKKKNIIMILSALLLQATMAMAYAFWLKGIKDEIILAGFFLLNLFLGWSAYFNRSILASAFFSYLVRVLIDAIIVYRLL